MNHLAFSFDPSWFLTVPGLLITGGVLLLIIALIIFIATSGKGAKKEKAKKKDEFDFEADDSEVEEEPSVSLEVKEEEKKPFIQIPEEEEVEPSFEAKDVPVSVEKEIPREDFSTSFKEEESLPSMMPDSQPVLPVEDRKVEPSLPIEHDFSVKEEVSLDSSIPSVVEEEKQEDKVSIYGGVSPVIPPIVEEKKESHQIYGGANPLDATQSIPIVQEKRGYASSLKETIGSVDDLANFRPIDTTPVVEEQKEETTKKDDVEMLDF